MLSRYHRQDLVIGVKGTEKLRSSTVAVFGLGGLGTVVAMYLAGAGVGKLIIVDRDIVSITDLHRQVLYRERHLGRPKAIAAADELSSLNHEVSVEPIYGDAREVAHDVIHRADLVIDALDNWPSRAAVSDVAWSLGKPLIHGGAQAYYGQVTTIVPGVTPRLSEVIRGGEAACIGICEAMGILGPAAAVIGSVMAAEAINALLGSPKLVGKILFIDVKHMVFEIVEITQRRTSA